MAIAALVAVLAAVAVFLIIIGLRPAHAGEVDLLEARLAQFTEAGRAVQSLQEVELSLPFFDRVIKPVFDRWSRRLQASTGEQRSQALQEKLNLAGRPWGVSVGGYQLMRIVVGVIGVAIGVMLFVVMGPDAAPLNFLVLVLGIVVGFMLPETLLSRKVRARQKEILLAMPSALDLLTISVEAGLGFDAALSRVADKYRNALTLEFSQVLNEVRLGRPRLEALDDMGRRNKVEELNNFVQAVIQSEQLGVGIANVLRIQSEEIRRRRRQRAEEQGQKAPIKMLLPMVGCIFPTLFIVLLGPAALTVFKQFSSGG